MIVVSVIHLQCWHNMSFPYVVKCRYCAEGSGILWGKYYSKKLNNNIPRYRCRECKRTFMDYSNILFTCALCEKKFLGETKRASICSECMDHLDQPAKSDGRIRIFEPWETSEYSFLLYVYSLLAS
jgi:hypothetical protein